VGEWGKSMAETARVISRRHRGDMRWMEVRGRTFYAVQAVPRPLWPRVGKRRLVKSLGTRDHHVAVARRHAALAEFQRLFDRVRGGDGHVEAALDWRETLAALERGDTSRFSASWDDGPVSDPEELRSLANGVLDEEADRIECERGRGAANAFVGIARGTATPLLLHIDAWLREGGAKGPLTARTQGQYRSDMHGFADWARSIGISTVEAVSEIVAGRYVTEHLLARGVHWATANRRITAASAYWRWLRKRAGVKVNPWTGQSLSKRAGRNGDKTKRPFSDAEAATLLTGGAGIELADAMHVAALSGMRLEEIYRLTAADCTGGWFRVRDAKTRAGRRRVPIHPALAALVARRCKGKPGSAFLFHEPGPVRDGRERSMALSKRFGYYRRTLGVHETLNGARHSRVDFHSWRRWFITAARNAGVDRAVVAAVVGHEVGNLTDDTYSGGPDEKLLRACVEAVRLPGAT
jgi:integrase